MYFIFHTRNGYCRNSVFFQQRTHFFREKGIVISYIMIGVHTDHRVKKFFCKRHILRVCMYGNYQIIYPVFQKPPVIICGGYPKIQSKYLYSILLCQKNGSQSVSAAQIKNSHSGFQRNFIQKLLQNHHRVGAHHIFLQKIFVILFCFIKIHIICLSFRE